MGRPKSIKRRENELISMAYDLIEERLKNKTATAQEILYIVRTGSSQTKLEREVLEEQKKLVSAKANAVSSEQESKKVYAEVLDAIQRYKGYEPDEDYEDYFSYDE